MRAMVGVTEEEEDVGVVIEELVGQVVTMSLYVEAYAVEGAAEEIMSLRTLVRLYYVFLS